MEHQRKYTKWFSHGNLTFTTDTVLDSRSSLKSFYSIFQLGLLHEIRIIVLWRRKKTSRELIDWHREWLSLRTADKSIAQNDIYENATRALDSKPFKETFRYPVSARARDNDEDASWVQLLVGFLSVLPLSPYASTQSLGLS